MEYSRIYKEWVGHLKKNGLFSRFLFDAYICEKNKKSNIFSSSLFYWNPIGLDVKYEMLSIIRRSTMPIKCIDDLSILINNLIYYSNDPTTSNWLEIFNKFRNEWISKNLMFKRGTKKRVKSLTYKKRGLSYQSKWYEHNETNFRNFKTIR